MTTLYFKKLLQLITSLLLFTGLQAVCWSADEIKLSTAWIAEGPPHMKMLAGYVTIKNLGNTDTELLKVSSPFFKTVEIHETQIISNIARMIEQDGLDIEKHSTVKFAPGGLHLMLIGAKKSLKQGDSVKFEFTFEKSVKKTITAKVRKR